MWQLVDSGHNVDNPNPRSDGDFDHAESIAGKHADQSDAEPKPITIAKPVAFARSIHCSYPLPHYAGLHHDHLARL